MVAATIACGSGENAEATPDAPALSFDSASLRVATPRDTVVFQVELAVSPAQRQLGLMERHHLAQNEGMLFAFDSVQPPDAGFWMYRTRIPLDIAYADSLGVIRAVRQMVPCETTLPRGCPSYPPGVPYRFALELNAGALRRFGVDSGSRLLVGELAALARPASAPGGSDTIRLVATGDRVGARCYRSPHSVLFGPPTTSGQQGRGPGWLGVQLARDSGLAELVDADRKGFTAFWRRIPGDTVSLLAADDFLRVELRVRLSDSVASGPALARSDATLERDATGRFVELRRDWTLRASRAPCDSMPVRSGRWTVWHGAWHYGSARLTIAARQAAPHAGPLG
jgi:uncharacterized membrane protein (UPF0127 family)